jgi:hypothetical protein
LEIELSHDKRIGIDDGLAQVLLGRHSFDALGSAFGKPLECRSESFRPVEGMAF